MTPAELKTLREKWGLSLNWLAKAGGVQLRSAQYWESGKRDVPEDVAALMTIVDMRLWEIVDRSVEFVLSLDPRPECVVLIRYKTDEDLHKYRPDMVDFPARAHAMILARSQEAFDVEGIAVKIVYLDPEPYEAWLKLTQKTDSEQTRAEWASTLET